MIAPTTQHEPHLSAPARYAVTGGKRYRFVRWKWRVLFGLLDLLGGLCFRLARWLSGEGEARKKPVRRILLVQLDHLGDAVLSAPLVNQLVRRFPAATIEVLASAASAELFTMLPGIARVHISHSDRFVRSQRWPLAWLVSSIWWGLSLGRRNFDLAIDPRGDFSVALILWLSAAHYRVGWSSGGGGFFLTHPSHYVPGRHELDSREALWSTIVAATGDGRTPRRAALTPHVPVEPAAAEYVRRELSFREAVAPRHGPRVVLHVGAGTAAKRWPAESWRALVERLLGELAAQIIVVGQDDAQTPPLDLSAFEPARVIDWRNGLTLAQLTATLALADLVIGADSGPAHLASAVGTPVVVLFSGTNLAEQWRPRGSKVLVLSHAVACRPCHRTRCPLAGHPCMRGLAVTEVFEAAATLVSPLGARSQPQTTLNTRPRDHSAALLG